MRKYLFLFVTMLASLTAAAQAPTANFTASQMNGCGPLVISFQDLSTGNPTDWLWDFGNGITSTLQHPSTTFFSAGTYTISLTVSNGSGSHTLTRQQLITIYEKPIVKFGADRTSGCFPLPVQFTDSSAAGAGSRLVSWQWDFGNGVQSTERMPQVQYGQAGNYAVGLRVTNDKGCTAVAVKSAYIAVSGRIQSAFSNSAVNQCQAPFPVQFTNATTGPGNLTYEWHFGDGGISEEKDPSHAYSAPGTYSVLLAVKSSEGCSDTLQKINHISIPAVSTSMTAPDSICAVTAATFSSTATPAVQSVLWQFGDGSQANTATATKSYMSAGTYNVQLITNFSHCSDTMAKQVTVSPRPKTQFSAVTRASCQPPLTVRFTDATPDAVSWAWNFGDGKTSTEQNPVHTYTAYGSYTVTLITTTSIGCSDTLQQAAYIKVQKPVVTLTSLPRSGCLPYTTTFNAAINIVDAVTSYNWNLGHGVTSTAASPTTTYTQQGRYPVSLTITTSGGCTETVRVNNAIVVGTRPTVDFTASSRTICASQTVTFTGTASAADTWQWTIPGVTTSTLQNPSITFPKAGVYNVTLAVTNSGCRQTITKQNFITVQPPVSGFSFTKDCNSPRRFLFTDESVDATAWAWNFGDGNTSTAKNPSHFYNGTGSFTVSLTATNGTCSHTTTKTVIITETALTFTANRQEACKTASIQFTAQAPTPGLITAYNWDFSNGTVATGINPLVPYSAAGNYTTRLITTDIFGCKDTLIKPNFIRINGPTARFQPVVANGCAGLTAVFKDITTTDGRNAITDWRWNYGDGTEEALSGANEVKHLYPSAGTFSVRLAVTDAAGCKDSFLLSNLVQTSSPKAAFSTLDTVPCLGSSVQFTNNSAAQNFTSQWSFGDGQSNTATHPLHRYADTGTYSVQLKITDSNGCTDSVTQARYIRVARTVARFTPSSTVGTCTPYEVRFTNNSSGYIGSSWNFTTGTSTAKDPSHLFLEAGTYPVTLYVTGQGGCIDSSTQTITIYPDSATQITYTPTEGCSPVVLKATVKGPVDKNYTWDFGDGTLVSTKETETVHTYKAIGNYLPRLILSDSGNCLLPFTGKETVKVLGARASFGWDKKLLCDSGAVQFIDSTRYNDSGITWQWQFGDGTSSSEQNPVHIYRQPGLYPVTLAVQTSSQCKDTAVAKSMIKVVQSPLITISGPDSLCKDQTAFHAGRYLRQDTSAVQWFWQFPDGNFTGGNLPPARHYNRAGNFTITAVAINSSGCTDTAARQLKVHPLPTVSAPPLLTSRVGTPVAIQPVNYSADVVQYLWSPADGLSCTTCPQPDAQPKFNTTYRVVATNASGCQNSAEVQVNVFCQNANVFVPNTFSPNADGSNDVFYVRGSGLARVKSLRIYNRLGEIIFQQQNFAVNTEAAGWDGTYKGKPLAPDTYIYQVEVFCDNSELIRFDGSVTLIR